MNKQTAIKEAYKALRGHYPTQLVFHYKGHRITVKDFKELNL